MSLVLTELTDAGIVMVTDSAISMLRRGRIETVDQKHWKKVLKVPRISAGISYWGSIGYVTTERFDHWLERKIATGIYTDLITFADYIVTELNQAAGNKLIEHNQPAGFHVAGYHPWLDGIRRPTFFHIHNGHGGVVFTQLRSNMNGREIVTETDPRCHWEQRERFIRYNDFYPDQQNLAALTHRLSTVGHFTRNGDYAPFVIISEGMAGICGTLNTIPGVSVPRQGNALGPRLGFLTLVMETVIGIYKCSSMSKTIGGHVQSLGIRPDATYL